jgi:hypothetical protein
MSDTGWIQNETSYRGDLKRELTLRGRGTDPVRDATIYLCVYDLDKDKDPAPDRRFRAHATLDGHELFRIVAATREDAIADLENELRGFATDILAALGGVTAKS